MRLHFIDPAYAEKDGTKGYDLLTQRKIDIFSDVFRFERTTPTYTSNKDSCTYFDKKLTVSMIDFGLYLNNPLDYQKIDSWSTYSNYIVPVNRPKL